MAEASKAVDSKFMERAYNGTPTEDDMTDIFTEKDADSWDALWKDNPEARARRGNSRHKGKGKVVAKKTEAPKSEAKKMLDAMLAGKKVKKEI